MSDKITKSPQIRFAGFTDAWEQRRLNEYLTTSKVKNKDERFGKEDVLSVSGDFGIVNQIEFQGRSFAGVSVAPYGVVETDDVVYTKSPLKSNPFGIIKTNKGQTGIVSTLYAVYKPNNNVDSKFVERYFENDQRLNRYLKPLVNKGAKNDMKVSDDNALIGTVVFPVEVDEQREISSFFNQLDNLITLHQRELELLKDTKKSLLQKMFPRDGANVPEIRFAGFTDAWEQRKFIELLDVKDGIRRGPFGSALKKDLFVPKSDYVVYEQQNAIYDKWGTRYNITKEKFDELHKFVLSEGDFIMSGAGTIGRIAKVPKGIKQGVFNQALIRFKINPELTDSNYFLEWIRSDNMQRKFTESNPGSAMTNLVPMSEVKEWGVSLPSLAEQQKIGEFFAELSDTIALHQCEINSLKNLKKSLLQQIFV
ncbi:restriction endonuclease subunit S [Bacillus cereus]|uniref:restriction endonuclease subunit S n=1 Tax=Bacillus cereus TaxID=1396 RepID=UPI0002790A99|nr:restriction endonuclease subunit S [Bacillus cereus]EJP94121.1 hypothetical protein IC3_02298 [Bacillus cereus VD142]